MTVHVLLEKDSEAEDNVTLMLGKWVEGKGI